MLRFFLAQIAVASFFFAKEKDRAESWKQLLKLKSTVVFMIIITLLSAKICKFTHNNS